MSIQNNNSGLRIGLFGFGVVGESLWRVLQENTSLHAQVVKVCIRHADKPRKAPANLFTTNANDLLSDESINVIVELIDDADAAYHIVTTALKNGKAVVSANKKLIATHLPTLLALQEEYKTPLLYEAACCASIPVIRNLEEYYDNDLLQSVTGIVNGSTNYILSRIAAEGISFEQALRQAQEKGFAESDPTLDIEGIDAVNKLSILLLHAYGIIAAPAELIHAGITRLHPADARYAKEKGYTIKLVAQARKTSKGVAAFVLPQFVPAGDALAQVHNEYNGVIIESSLADKQFFNGKGAGGYPTASAVISDISALRYRYKYEYKKLYYQQPAQLTDDFFLRVYLSFDALYQVPHEAFEYIEEWASSDERCAVTGVIHFSKLAGATWWQKKGTSIILLPEPFDLPQRKRATRINEEWVLN